MQRNEWVSRIFPRGIPELWCPLITHFSAPAEPDGDRIAALLGEIAPRVKGLLMPGSTGEGWDMSDRDALRLLETVLPVSRSLGQYLLIGALKPTAAETVQCIDATMRWLVEFAGVTDEREAMAKYGIAGFTVCPPRGGALSQDEIRTGLEEILRRGLPLAIYQLPQVTGNRMSPETVAVLAETRGNFLLFKDTSGEDTVARAPLDYRGVYFVRGAEGDYSRHPRTGGGAYDGFLLSTANAFSVELARILELLRSTDGGGRDEADELSRRVGDCVERVFPPAGEIGAGNAFANANKAFDHLRAWGPEAEEREPPMLYGGSRLPRELIAMARAAMEHNGFDLSRGYLQQAR